MSEQLPRTIAPLRNVAALITLVDRVQNRDLNLPGMAVFYGRSGYGKTSAATVAANEFNAHSVQVKEGWSATHFCNIVLQELGVRPKGTFSEKLDEIGIQLMRSGRPLLVDDAQYMNTDKKIGLIRDIYESSQSTIVLIGEEGLPATLTKWENVHNRILSWVPAEHCTIADARILAPIYARDVEVAQELLEKIVTFSTGSMRRVATNLSEVRSFAHSKGLNSVGMAEFDIERFNTGQPPQPRKPRSIPPEELSDRSTTTSDLKDHVKSIRSARS